MISFIFIFILLISNLLSFNNPIISILIPIFNTKYLKNCLNRIIEQSFNNIEIICINNGKNKLNFENILNDNRIIMINNLQNNNYINIGLEYVSGEYIAIVDSSDLINNNIFENLYKLTKNGYFDVIRTNNYLFYEKKIVDKFNILKFFYYKILNLFKIQNNFKIHSYIWKGIYKKEIINNIKFKFIQTTGIVNKDIDFFFQ